jgi:hypothetical protein
MIVDLNLFDIQTLGKIRISCKEFMHIIDRTDVTILQNKDKYYYTGSHASLVPP